MMSIIATMFILQGILSGANGAADIGPFNISDHVKPRMDLIDVETFP
jgi:hypothetical protein